MTNESNLPRIVWDVYKPEPMPSVERHKNHGFTVAHDQKLGYWSFDRDADENTPSLTVYLSDEAQSVIGKNHWRGIRNLIEQAIGHIELDPYGETSIDPNKDELKAQDQRTVNRLTDELSSLMGTPLAAKGTGRDKSPYSDEREDLLEQFKLMRQSQIESEANLGPEQLDVLRFCRVYGALSYPDSTGSGIQQWLFMEHVKDAAWVEDIGMNMALIGGTKVTPGFRKSDHPRLAELADPYDPRYRDLMAWSRVEEFLNREGIRTTDLVGRNVLCYTDNNNVQHYVIIDQREH